MGRDGLGQSLEKCQHFKKLYKEHILVIKNVTNAEVVEVRGP